MEQYRWADGSCMRGDANIAGSVCAQLEAEGRLSAEELVNVSRDVNSLLHDMFEWDDTIAAEKYRETQASKIIRSLVLRVEDKPLSFRAFSSIESNVYMSTMTAMQRMDTRAILLKNAKAELAAFRRKYATLNELKKVFAVIDEVVS